MNSKRTLIIVAALLGFSLSVVAEAQTYTVLHNFNGVADGANPVAGLTIDRTGNLYGTASAGGNWGYGTVYRLAPSGSNWNFSVLYTFLGLGYQGTDAGAPYSRVTIGPDGALYGTTHAGATGDQCRELHGCGAVYRLQPVLGGTSATWKETVIYAFGYYDGDHPNYGDVVFDQAGNLYGATFTGGAYLQGAVYKLAPFNGGWKQSVIHSFSGVDGNTPFNGPTLDRAGNLYGTTSAGGASGLGTVYQLTPSGSTWTANILHNFQGATDGATPSSGIVLDAGNNLYGATEVAGSGADGTAFELSSPTVGVWNLNTLVDFVGAPPAPPYRTLAMDSNGNLYGTSAQDGAHQAGVVFKLTNAAGSWNYSVLHTFTGGLDGGLPFGSLLIDSSGNVYGTASTGGVYGNGVVFQIKQN
jgi:uncharacterized repeat protein (TIGR03803 family)